MKSHLVKIRKATSDDFNSINSLNVELYEIHHFGAPHIFKETGATKSGEARIESNKCSLQNTIVATIDNVVVGYLEFSEKIVEESMILHPRKMYSVNDLVVSENNRGRKIGKALLDELEMMAKKNSFDSVEVPVFSFNVRAIEFYKKNGYSEYVIRVRKVL